MRVGIIGAGNVVHYGHFPALNTLKDEVQVVALADFTPVRREAARQLFGLAEADCYADGMDVIRRPDVEALLVAVPQQFRRDLVIAAAKAGKHILSEKPISTTPADADTMIAAAREAGVVFGICHNYLWLPEYQQIRALLDAGKIGEWRVGIMNFLGVQDRPGAAEYKPAWRHGVEAGGGVLMDMIHAIYLVEYVFGGEIQKANATIANLVYPDEPVEDTALVQYALPQGYVMVNMGWGVGPGGIEIGGTEGRLMMFYKKYGTGGWGTPDQIHLVTDSGEHSQPVVQPPVHADMIANSFKSLWQDFVAAIHEKRETAAPASSGARALQATLAAYLSGAEGRAVSLPLPTDHPVYQQGLAGIKATK